VILTSILLSSPNFKVDAEASVRSLNLTPSLICPKNDRVNVLIEQQKNILQIIPKVQKVAGLDNSYENRAPPIGAPNAALTPADAPPARNSLFATSFLK